MHPPPALARCCVMKQQPTVLERAHQLATSGRYRTLSDIKAVLRRERFKQIQIEDQLYGLTVRLQLQKLCRDATEKKVTSARTRSS